MNLLLVAVCAAAAFVAAPRWLRIAQREHYLPPSVVRFAARWWGANPTNTFLALGAVLASITALSVPLFALVSAGVVAVGPLGLRRKGRTSPLAWTRRLRTVAIVAGTLDVLLFAVAVIAGAVGPSLAAMLCFFQPLVVDVALAVTRPFERRAAQRWVAAATAKVRAVRPTTVAITGSYGKTSTKLYVAHLVGAVRTVLASPASFNNTAGLSRTLNEHLVPGTEVFVAEMGTYGAGEIRSMCSWVQPDIGVIVNIGPVHLERMRTIERIVAAKAEILEGVRVAVLNVSAPGLATVADETAARGTRVIRVATEDVDGADVVVEDDGGGGLDVRVGDQEITLDEGSGHGAQAANVAAALGVVLALDLPVETVLPRLTTLPAPPHRQQVERSAKGVMVIDNTFSSNPASAESSLELVERLAKSYGRTVVVTPGMVELGRQQAAENARFAEAAAGIATDFVIVGYSNRKALLTGAKGRAARVRLANTRNEAVSWVRDTLTDGDVVLYENDLPDHYP